MHYIMINPLTNKKLEDTDKKKGNLQAGGLAFRCKNTSK